ncbi:MAG: hypothetical protein JSV62_00905 [Promethearchaeota archaeon]|nr:MAG: hypothetical protein JSV62_00905 [Candidatus Lokiarchaeota archaeon]
MKFNIKIIVIIIASALAGSGITTGVFFYIYNQPTGRDGENKPPIISELPDITISEDSPQLDAFNLSDYSSDPESDPLNYSILVNSNPNCGVSIDTDNLVDIIPLAEWSGVSYVIIEVSDGKLTDTDVFKVNVTIVNDPLFIVDFSPLSYSEINENESQEFAITITDVDNTLFTYEWNIWYKSTGINFSYTGGTSENYIYETDYFSNGTHTVKVNITDGEYVVEKIWTLTVNNINRAPEIVWYSPTDLTPYIYEDQQITFRIRVKDLDGDPLNINWYVDDVLTKIGGNYTFSGDYHPGMFEIKVIITDGELEAEKIWDLTVLPSP